MKMMTFFWSFALARISLDGLLSLVQSLESETALPFGDPGRILVFLSSPRARSLLPLLSKGDFRKIN